MELVLQLVPALRQVTAAHHLLEDGKVFVRDSSKGVFTHNPLILTAKISA